MADDVRYDHEMTKGRQQSKIRFYYQKILPLNLINSSKTL